MSQPSGMPQPSDGSQIPGKSLTPAAHGEAAGASAASSEQPLNDTYETSRRTAERRRAERRDTDRRVSDRRRSRWTDVGGARDELLPNPHTAGSAEAGGDPTANWELVRAAQAGDAEAFGALYDRYVDQVFGFILGRVSDRSLAEDLTSETFVRAFRKIATISYQGRDIGAWFTTIARNMVLDHAKSAHSRHEVSTADTGDNPDIEEASHDSAELTVLNQLANSRLLAAVRELGQEQQECIALRFIQGLSLAETAQRMGKTEGSVKALQYRAVKRLASQVPEDLD